MIYIDEIKHLRIYNKPFLLPINMKDKKKGKAVMLLTPNIESSIGLMNHKLLINKYYNSYYIEKDISFYINDKNILEQYDYSNYVHESVEGEDTCALNEGVYKYFKQRIIFDGYSDDVEEARKYITIDKIEQYNSIFRSEIQYPISISVYRGVNELPKNTASSISIFGYKNWCDSKEYELYCSEAIIEMIIRNINPHCYSGIVDAVSSVYSGTYDIYKDDISNPEYSFCCRTIKEIMIQPNGNSKIVSIIRKNNISKLFSKAVDMNSNNIKEIIKEDTLDPIAKLKRNITYHSRKGSAHILNKVINNIEKTVDPDQPNPTYDTVDHSIAPEECSLDYMNDDYLISESYIRLSLIHI